MTSAHDSREKRNAANNRFLRPIGDVRSGETTTALLLLGNLFLLLTAYYVMKTVREPLILATGGAEAKSYAAALQAMLLVGFVPLYGWFSSRVGRLALLLGITAFFAGQLLLFALGARLELPFLGIAFYVWVGLFSLVAIAQFWSLANDIYSPAQGTRLFPVIALGATLGSPAGSQIAAWLFESGMAASAMLLIAAGLLLLHGAIAVVIHYRESAPGRPREAPLPRAGGFELVLRSPYLRGIALLLVLLNVVNTTGEYVLSRTVLEAAREAMALDPALSMEAFIGAFYGRFFFWVNVAALAIQALLVSRLVRAAGLAGALFALPLVAFGAYGLVAAGAGFALVTFVKGAENATDYSVMNTAKAMLWLPTSREEKYKGKQAIDSFFVRFGDLLAAGVVFVGTSFLGLDTAGFAAMNLFVIVAWAAVSLFVLRAQGRLTGEAEAPLATAVGSAA